MTLELCTSNPSSNHNENQSIVLTAHYYLMSLCWTASETKLKKYNVQNINGSESIFVSTITHWARYRRRARERNCSELGADTHWDNPWQGGGQTEDFADKQNPPFSGKILCEVLSGERCEVCEDKACSPPTSGRGLSSKSLAWLRGRATGPLVPLLTKLF